MKPPYYYCKTNNGTKSPSFTHQTVQGAKTEALRLLNSTNAEKVEILMCVGVVEYKDVPVTERKAVFSMAPENDLPF